MNVTVKVDDTLMLALNDAAVANVACNAIRDAFGVNKEWELDDGEVIIWRQEVIGFPCSRIETKTIRTADKKDKVAFAAIERVREFYMQKNA